jgi:hypothetical protein
MLLATVHSHETRGFIYSPVQASFRESVPADPVVAAGDRGDIESALKVLDSGRCSLSEALQRYATGVRQSRHRTKQSLRRNADELGEEL